MSNEIEKKNESMLATQVEVPMGFEDEDEGDMIIPRVKVINMLSPEFKEKVADEGDVINSLTKEKLSGKIFVPVFKFSSNILWKPRSEGGGILCQARDGKNATDTNGEQIKCIKCRKNEFDNTKQGVEAYPKCTKFINFFGFIEGDKMPIILSFAKTNYNEGKKLFSLAKVTMQNMWNHGYKLDSKKMAKSGNEWFNITVASNGITSDEDRAFGTSLFKMYRNVELNIDTDTETGATESAPSVDTNNTEF